MSATTAIGTLRLTGAAADTPALRLRVACELAGADLAPPGLPPAAVLVVRRLVDPLPRRLAGREPRVRPDPAWERAVRGRLADAARSAARPDGNGELPADAAAVLFADHAELLACVLRELVHGRLAERWWWRAVRRRLPPPAAAGLASGGAPSVLLAACPREAPAILEWLVRWGEAAAVAAALSPSGATRVLAALAAEHGLPRELVGPEDEAENSCVVRNGEAEPATTAPGGTLPPEPWRAWLPAALHGMPLAPEIRCLFGVALGLAAAPHRLRDRDTARQARRWWRTVTAVSVAPAAAQQPTAPDSVARRGSSPAAIPPQPGDAPAKAQAMAMDIASQKVFREPDQCRAESSPPAPLSPLPIPHTPGEGAPPPGRGGQGLRTPREALARHHGPSSQERAVTLEAAGPQAPPPAALAPPQPGAGSGPGAELAEPAVIEQQEDAQAIIEAPPQAALALAADGIATRVGGVLYLIHALLDLGLPEAFERGWRLASAAGPWGTLDLLGRGLLAERFAEVADDPLWAVLGELAGWSSGAALRHRTQASPAYRVPAAWPAKLADPGDRFSWSAAGGRLRLWSAAGWLLADVPRRSAPPSRQARCELARVIGAPAAAAAGVMRARATAAPLAHPRSSLPPGCPARFGRWLAAALPAVRRRLLLALGAGGPDPVAQALTMPGRVYVTSSHLDLVLPLDAADSAVRRAGLDRDPGWQPAFGRVVYFHFD